MRSRQRRVSLVGFAGLAVAVTLGSYAWACTLSGSHTGFEWICKNTASTTCNMSGLSPDGSNGRPTHALSFYSQASGLTPNGSYDMRWVNGDHTSNTDTACNTGTIFTNGANLIASGTGSWSAQGPLVMPNMSGVDITTCAQPLQGNASSQFLGSGHVKWSLM